MTFIDVVYVPFRYRYVSEPASWFRGWHRIGSPCGLTFGHFRLEVTYVVTNLFFNMRVEQKIVI